MVLRIAGAAAALCIAAFLAVELYAERRVADANDIAIRSGGRALPPHERHQVIDDLGFGADLRPGTQALITAAAVTLHGGDRRASERFARQAVEREPKNFLAWEALAVTLVHVDRATADRAHRKAVELNPLRRNVR